MKKRYIIINGPNLNLIGKREPSIYGEQDFETFFRTLRNSIDEVHLDYYHSNVEGELINKLHETGFSYDGIILNPGGYSHTSVALSDAIAAIASPVIEVHISNLYTREEYRHISLTAKNCIGVISGFGLWSYEMALQFFLES
ncbi:MAG: 3-dehydroquinate dehydratase [Crocinitomicaceae bacterium]|nr:3-dehydroquinate dehydratase [Crocinitomicaceae bacterium]